MKVFALTPILHDGVLYTFGQEIKASDVQGQSLIDQGVAATEVPQFMTAEQHESHLAAAIMSENMAKNTVDADKARAAGIAAEAQHEADVAQAKADSAATAAAVPTAAPAAVASAAAQTPVAPTQEQIDAQAAADAKAKADAEAAAKAAAGNQPPQA